MHECPKCHRDCTCDGSIGTEAGGKDGHGGVAAGECAHDCVADERKPLSRRYQRSVAQDTDQVAETASAPHQA